MAEYNNGTTNYGNCSYATLKNYNLGQPEVPICDSIPSMAVQLVPKYCPVGDDAPNYPPRYDTLQHGAKDGSCGGYFPVYNAYQWSNGKDCATTFTTRACDGYIDCQGIPPTQKGNWCA